MPEINFFWDPLSDNILQERDETGAVTAEYTTEPGLYGNVVSQNRGGVESQFHFDARGSTLAVTDDNQDATDGRAYKAFGETTESTGETTFPFQFIGRFGYYANTNSVLYHIRRRHYSPTFARWLSTDPIDYLIRPNRHSYAHNNPCSFIDPSGLQESPVPEKLPDILKVAPPNDQRADIEACWEFYSSTLQTHKGAVKCFQDYLKQLVGLSPLSRIFCSKVTFVCKCCGKRSHATYQAQIVSLCADAKSVKDKDANASARAICHELVHALQYAPCKKDGPQQGDVSCLQILKDEFQAYLCTGSCGRAGSIDIGLCARLAIASARQSGKCKELSDAEFGAIVNGELIRWVDREVPADDLSRFCPIQYEIPE